MTFDTLLDRHGWDQINLFENDLDLSRMTIWAHITDPHQRHTRGVEQYLKLNPDIDIDDQVIGKMLVSGVFDEHTYSLSMMLGALWALPINWIPLDASIIDYRVPGRCRGLNGDDLTNEFFQAHGLGIEVTENDHQNKSIDSLGIREKINVLKSLHNANYQKLVKNFLEPDVILYYQTLKKYQDKYQHI